MATTDGVVDIVFRVGGVFVPKRVHKKKSLIVYCGGLCYWRRGVKVNKLDVSYIREAAIHGFVNFSVNVPTLYSCWYRENGKTFNTGKREIVNEDEIRGLLQTVNGQGYVEVFVSSDESVRPNIVEAQHTPKKAVVPKGKSALGVILEEVDKKLRKGLQKEGGGLSENLDVAEVQIEVEDEGDSDELRSLGGSSDEEDHSPVFNDKVDFTKTVKLVPNLKFKDATVLRKALRLHAIENRYEFYFLHNDSTRITIQCRNRCGCQFSAKTSRMPLCTCVGGVRCNFKVYARNMLRQETWQIRSLRLEHNCMRRKDNCKVTSEWIADMYLEDFRSNPGWKVKQLRDRVLNDFGIQVSYYRAWMARCRAKLIIYGSASEQYARVWDYARAVIKHNPGSGCNVVVDSLSNPQPPLFMRMFVFLRPLKDGFLRGCRPIIGVDGCHLKGAYPGQILVVVSKDGNNSIYPLAWATVEIENRETWQWFLESLIELLGSDDGAGFTFMSDRQKGLVEALNAVVPAAETRFCVRHIWANFKLRFTGSVYKDLFWSAARSTTHFGYEVAMESIKALNEEAYEYLDSIPTQHWCRHAFTPLCRSNMLLNNMCETFNAVIKDARDKPILTQMEWMRRYMMNRNNEKWEDAKIITSNLTPYVRKIFQRMEFVSRNCIVQASRGDTYEVKLNDDQVVVDLGEGTCTCYHWQLTGYPCVHAYACVMDQRSDIEQFVHPYYSMNTYRKAYEPPIQPMPGPKQWDRVNVREPLPPAVKIQPGRPKLKKRKLE
ncbi:uncharacterized protein LOC110695848 [Chenopodium quinoa]|uniref:uncharacterized protein LOC110695848 n=1 Tax=Chenopodium quinoa TaxID=63459 RepID=UPI000B76D059|nr:uncharacterized protein LOC110695848 [Chenopodium quinoa]